ncbi:hypothetical protein [Clostridium cellulovorans]|uniref:Uncharacterized protein n=1 Tax=Clostridium cellulovorans (strain ATCC 35296 / DSM 3052 / OCM 3 / 743B) TaxID=573061 RepID=D9SND3_CLOC7|nr:hypothetical protein [Clostridium cellulovorans]ADL53925.1 hypothetical protein Clocel_4264 [Clostridium cellulovorans 743B]
MGSLKKITLEDLDLDFQIGDNNEEFLYLGGDSKGKLDLVGSPSVINSSLNFIQFIKTNRPVTKYTYSERGCC